MDKKTIHKMRKDAVEIFSSAIKAVEPGQAVKKNCALKENSLFLGKYKFDLRKFHRIFVIGAGKATAAMALALENILGEKISDGVISVKYGHGEPLNHIRLIEAGHPLPDKNSQKAASEILRTARSTEENDLIICLISGGGSALLALPAPGISLNDKQKTIKALLFCGATINEINAVRKHISNIKGGRLAEAAYPAALVTLILSDVVGDDQSVIASGPTVPDESTFKECLEIFKKYRLLSKIPLSVRLHLESGFKKKIPETPKAGQPCFIKAKSILVGNNFEAIFAAKNKAMTLGYNAMILSTMVEGDTTQAAKMHGAIAKEIIKTKNPLPSPACILSGGETTVLVKGTGLGGRNMEFALVFAQEIAGIENIVLLSAGSDGTDGPTDAAGAIADNYTCLKAQNKELSLIKSLGNNDSYNFFKAIGDLVITGPTKTNVMDIRIMLIS